MSDAQPPIRPPAQAPVRFSQDGALVVLTLARPEAANAQSSALLLELDGLLDRIAADPSVKVVLIEAEGKHFSAGHDLKEIMAGEDPWVAQRATPEGKLRHEQELYWAPMVKLRDLRPITIAAVQGACTAAGLMLACMCDLIVAADDARFSNPVLRMSGAAVELLVEPWEMGPRKAKEFLLCARTLTADEAERYGMVNRVVPRHELATAARAMANEVAMVPPVTAQAVKGSINSMIDRMGQRDSWRHHFMVHQFVSNTETALGLMRERTAGGMDHVKREQQ